MPRAKPPSRKLYAQWKHRFSRPAHTECRRVTASRFSLNGSTVVEPRAGLQYQLSAATRLSVAYGLHSALQPLLSYFTQTRQADGRYAQTNRDLGFTRSHHLVLALQPAAVRQRAPAGGRLPPVAVRCPSGAQSPATFPT